MRSVVRRAAAAAALALGVSAWTPYAAAEPPQPVDLGGAPVDASTDAGQPTRLEAGLWSTTIGPAAPAYFRYERQIKDSTVHIGVVAAPQTVDGDGVNLAAGASVEDAAPVDCVSDSASSDYTTPFALVGAEVAVGGAGPDDQCSASDSLVVEVGRYSSSSTGDLPVAIKVVEEAPVSLPGAEIPDDDALRYELPDPVEPADGPGGSDSFGGAPLLDPGDGPVTVEATIAQGAEALWRVPVDWGDQLVVRGDLAAVEQDTEQTEADPLNDVTVQLHLIQPSRDVYALTKSEDYSYGTYGAEDAVFVAAGYPLRYGNRSSDVEPTLPGDQWVAVSVEPAAEDAAPLDVPVTLTFAVTPTDAEPPTYPGAVLDPAANDGPSGYSRDRPFLVGDGEFSAVASGNPFTPDGDNGDDWWGPRRGVGLGVGVVSLACCAVGAVWLTRRRVR